MINGYERKLVDPRWQRARLETFARDDYRCRCCGRDDLELHAHHSYYEAGREPWDYPAESLITYCHACHEAEHGRSFAGDAGVLQLLRKAGFATVEDRLEAVCGFLSDAGPALLESERRELLFVLGVLVWARGELWAQVLALCEAHERAQPRYGNCQPEVVPPTPAMTP